MDKLPGRVLAFGGTHTPIEVLGGDDIGSQHGPEFGDFYVFLTEDGLAAVIRNAGLTLFPGDGVEWIDALLAQHSSESEAFGMCFFRFFTCVLPGRLSCVGSRWLRSLLHGGFRHIDHDAVSCGNAVLMS